MEYSSIDIGIGAQSGGEGKVRVAHGSVLIVFHSLMTIVWSGDAATLCSGVYTGIISTAAILSFAAQISRQATSPDGHPIQLRRAIGVTSPFHQQWGRECKRLP